MTPFHWGDDRFQDMNIIDLMVKIIKTKPLKNSVFYEYRRMFTNFSAFVDDDHISFVQAVACQCFVGPFIIGLNGLFVDAAAKT